MMKGMFCANYVETMPYVGLVWLIAFFISLYFDPRLIKDAFRFPFMLVPSLKHHGFSAAIFYGFILTVLITGINYELMCQYGKVK